MCHYPFKDEESDRTCNTFNIGLWLGIEVTETMDKSHDVSTKLLKSQTRQLP